MDDSVIGHARTRRVTDSGPSMLGLGGGRWKEIAERFLCHPKGKYLRFLLEAEKREADKRAGRFFGRWQPLNGWPSVEDCARADKRAGRFFCRW